MFMRNTSTTCPIFRPNKTFPVSYYIDLFSFYIVNTVEGFLHILARFGCKDKGCCLDILWRSRLYGRVSCTDS